MFISYDRANPLYPWKAPSKGWIATISALQLFAPAKTMVWEGLSLLPRRIMPLRHNLTSKIQLLWHIFTLKRLSYGIRFKTMLSMTKSWASFSRNHPLQHGSITVLQKLYWPWEWTHTISVARLQTGHICIFGFFINVLISYWFILLYLIYC